MHAKLVRLLSPLRFGAMGLQLHVLPLSYTVLPTFLPTLLVTLFPVRLSPGTLGARLWWGGDMGWESRGGGGGSRDLNLSGMGVCVFSSTHHLAADTSAFAFCSFSAHRLMFDCCDDVPNYCALLYGCINNNKNDESRCNYLLSSTVAAICVAVPQAFIPNTAETTRASQLVIVRAQRGIV